MQIAYRPNSASTFYQPKRLFGTESPSESQKEIRLQFLENLRFLDHSIVKEAAPILWNGSVQSNNKGLEGRLKLNTVLTDSPYPAYYLEFQSDSCTNPNPNSETYYYKITLKPNSKKQELKTANLLFRQENLELEILERTNKREIQQETYLLSFLANPLRRIRGILSFNQIDSADTDGAYRIMDLFNQALATPGSPLNSN